MIRTYDFVPVRRWCRRAECFADLLAGGEGWVPCRSGHIESLDPPDFGDPSDLVGLRRQVTVGDAFVAALDDVVVDKFCPVPFPVNSYNVFVAPSLALADTWHDEASHAALLERRGETGFATVGGRRLACRLYDDAEPDLRVEPAALLLASRFTHSDYAHWMLDLLPRLWALSLFERSATLPLVVPDATLAPFQQETLRALGVTNPLIPLNCRRAHFDRLYLPSFFAPGALSRVQAQWIGSRLRRVFGVEGGRAGGRGLLVAGHSGGRGFADPDALARRLAPLGFETVRPGDLSVAERARLFAAARVVVAPEGPGNADMLFAPPDAALIEVCPAGQASDQFHLLTKLGGQRYGRVLGTAGEEGLRVDVDRVMAAVVQALRAW
ncbi:MAG: glycosyltransferase family 61 protein [Alphaproteobacteria bacterium]|nr:glycosyltransferase family 61 protein [Alphaproteobacteria bacterium]MBF0392740.1 glycosyltransferase family 61 protein [Alphaproteobacteria bacterium]